MTRGNAFRFVIRVYNTNDIDKCVETQVCNSVNELVEIIRRITLLQGKLVFFKVEES